MVAAGFDVKLPDQLVRVEKVGQFRQLVEMSEASNDLKNKVRRRRGAKAMEALAVPYSA